MFGHRAYLKTAENYEKAIMPDDIPAWNDAGTTHPEELILVTEIQRELEAIMSNYVGIVRSNRRLKRAMDRLELMYIEHEELYKQSKVSVRICELRNMIEVAYLVIKAAMARRENRGLHFNLDNVKQQG